MCQCPVEFPGVSPLGPNQRSEPDGTAPGPDPPIEPVARPNSAASAFPTVDTGSGGYRLDPPATHGVRDVHHLPVFGHRTACDVYPFPTQDRHNLIVRKNPRRFLGADQLPD